MADLSCPSRVHITLRLCLGFIRHPRFDGGTDGIGQWWRKEAEREGDLSYPRRTLTERQGKNGVEDPLDTTEGPKRTLIRLPTGYGACLPGGIMGISI
jgi:hypothetical protein